MRFRAEEQYCSTFIVLPKEILIYWSIFVPTHSDGHECWAMTERTRFRIQADNMGFLRKMADFSLSERVISLTQSRTSYLRVTSVTWDALDNRQKFDEPSQGVLHPAHHAWSQTKDSVEGLYLLIGLETPQDPWVRVGWSHLWKESVGFPAETAAPTTHNEHLMMDRSIVWSINQWSLYSFKNFGFTCNRPTQKAW